MVENFGNERVFVARNPIGYKHGRPLIFPPQDDHKIYITRGCILVKKRERGVKIGVAGMIIGTAIICVGMAWPALVHYAGIIEGMLR